LRFLLNSARIFLLMYTPKYRITNRILRFISSIEACKEVIDHAPLLPFYEKQFQQDAIIRSVHYGTHLEGNELDLTQAERVIKGEEVLARERDIQEVINYRKVIEYISQWEDPNFNKEITESVIKHIHSIVVDKILPKEKQGEYRSSQVVIKNSYTGHVSFRPPPSALVPIQIRELLEFLGSKESNDVHSVLKSGIVHFEFVRIHPFVDGNGRVGRALSTLILFEEGYDIRRFFSLEEYYDKNASKYYQALQSVEKNDNDLTLWLDYFTEGLAVELSRVKNKVEKISVDGKLRQKLGGKPLLLSERQLKIIEYIQEVGYLQNKAFASLFPMVSEDTVLNDLKELLKNGIIKKQGSTKGAKYIMS